MAAITYADDAVPDEEENSDQKADDKEGKGSVENEKEDEYPPAYPEHPAGFPPDQAALPSTRPQPTFPGIADEFFTPPDLI